MLQQYATFFQAILALYCVSSLLFIRRPLAAMAYFLAFRTIFSLPADLQIPSFFGMPYFIPALFFLLISTVITLVRSPSRFKLHFPFLLYVLFLSAIVADDGMLVLTGVEMSKLIEEITKMFFPMLAYFLVYCGVKEQDDLNKVGLYMMLVCLIPMIVGWVSFFSGTGYSVAQDSLVPLAAGPVSTTGGRNSFGIFLSLCLFLAIPYAIKMKTTGSKLYVALLVAMIVISENRGTWIALFAAFAVSVALFKSHLRLQKWVLCITAVMLLASPIMISRFNQLETYNEYGDKNDTAADRVELSKFTLNLAMQSPIIGNGPFSSAVRGSTLPHNDYLRLASEYGFPIMFLYVLFLFSQLWWTIKHRKDALWQYQFASCAAQIYLIVLSIAQNIIGYTTFYVQIFAIMALSHRAAAMSLSQKKPARLLHPNIKPLSSP